MLGTSYHFREGDNMKSIDYAGEYVYQNEKLSNGAPLIIAPVKGSKTTTITIGYKAGAFYEEGFGSGSYDGISHFLEHMFFKGTPNLSTKEINDSFTRLGAMLNAFTANEMTVYFAKVPMRNIEGAIELWGEMLNNIQLQKEEFELERQVVLQEEKIGRDNPLHYALHRVGAMLFKGTQLEHDIIGTQSSLKGITMDMMDKYIDTYYIPENSVIAISGGVSDEIKSKVEQEFCQKSREITNGMKKINPWSTINPNWEGVHEYGYKEMNRPLSYAAFEWAGYSSNKDLLYPLELLETYIDESKTSLFYKKLVSKGICPSAGLYFSKYPNVFSATSYFITMPQLVPKVHKIIIEEILKKVASLEVTEELLEKLKLELLGRRILSWEDNISLALDHVTKTIYQGDISGAREYILGIQEVSTAELKEAIALLFQDVNWSLYIAGAIPASWEPPLGLQ